MRFSRQRIHAVIIAVCLFLTFFSFSFARPAFSAVNEAEWTLDVAVVPPDEGWESEAGASIQKTLLWHQAVISESGDGILGHDVGFVFLPPIDEKTAAGYSIPVSSHTVAVLSFASPAMDRTLIPLMKGKGVPLMLAGGESVFFYEQGRLIPFVFALDLFRDYRCRAFAEYAAKILQPDARIGVLGMRFTQNEEREAKICSDLLMEARFQPMTWWVDASTVNTFDIVGQEVQNYTQGVLISSVGGMATKEIWRGIMNERSPYRLWYGDAPNRSFLSFRGIIFADQNMYLDTLGGFEQLKRSLWASRTVSVTDKVAAGRANALVLWLTEALKTLPSVENKSALPAALARVRGVPFGHQTLDIDAKTHRPARRQVRMLEIRNREFFILDTLDIRGLEYYDY